MVQFIWITALHSPYPLWSLQPSPAWSQEDAQQLSQTQLQKNQAPLQ